MRRAAAVLVALLLIPTPAHASPGVAKLCQQQAQSPESVRALIRCVAPKLGVSTSHALYIAWRESHDEPWAKNPSSSAAGVFQVVSGTWRSFVRSYLYGHALGPVNVYNGRMNVVLSLRAVRHGGWGPWGG